MQLKFGLFKLKKILPSIKAYYIFAISTLENCGGINQSQFIYFWKSRGNWTLEATGVAVWKIWNAWESVWSTYPEKKYLSVLWAEPPLAVFKSLCKQSHTRCGYFDVDLILTIQLLNFMFQSNVIVFWEQISHLWQVKTWFSL